MMVQCLEKAAFTLCSLDLRHYYWRKSLLQTGSVYLNLGHLSSKIFWVTVRSKPLICGGYADKCPNYIRYIIDSESAKEQETVL